MSNQIRDLVISFTVDADTTGLMLADGWRWHGDTLTLTRGDPRWSPRVRLEAVRLRYAVRLPTNRKRARERAKLRRAARRADS